MPLISIIIPVYNVNSFLPKLFTNLRQQDLTQAEVIFIDDGSTDGSSDTLDRLSKGTGYKVIHQTNAGVAAARNKGLSEARGDYLCFIDPDDAISSNYIKAFKENILKCPADIVIANWSRVTGKGVTQPFLKQKSFDEHPTPRQILSEILKGKTVLGSLWGKLFAAKLFDNNIFPLQRTCSDFLPVMNAILSAQTFNFLPDAVYYYTCDRGTSLQNTQNMNDVKDSVEVHIQAANRINAQYDDLSDLITADMLDASLDACKHICCSLAIPPDLKKTQFKLYNRYMRQHLVYVIHKVRPFKHACMMLCVALGYTPTRLILRAKGKR